MQKAMDLHQRRNVIGVEAFEKHVPGVGVQRQRHVDRHEEQTERRGQGQAQQQAGRPARPGGDQAEGDGQRLQHGARRGRHFQPAFRVRFGDVAADDDHPDQVDPQADHGVVAAMVEAEKEDGEAVVDPQQDGLGERQQGLDQPASAQPGQADGKCEGDDQAQEQPAGLRPGGAG